MKVKDGIYVYAAVEEVRDLGGTEHDRQGALSS